MVLVLLLLVVVALLVPQTFARAKLAPSGYALLASGGTTPAAGSGGAGPQSPIAGGHAASSV